MSIDVIDIHYVDHSTKLLYRYSYWNSSDIGIFPGLNLIIIALHWYMVLHNIVTMFV